LDLDINCQILYAYYITIEKDITTVTWLYLLYNTNALKGVYLIKIKYSTANIVICFYIASYYTYKYTIGAR